MLLGDSQLEGKMGSRHARIAGASLRRFARCDNQPPVMVKSVAPFGDGYIPRAPPRGAQNLKVNVVDDAAGQ